MYAGGAVETYLTVEELASHLKVADKIIRKWVLNREIPFFKIKKVIRFRLSEIEPWVKSGGMYAVTGKPPTDAELGLFDETETEGQV
jgi:excisionase family DNA binding protein